MSKSLYISINNYCNSNCLFCAEDVDLVENNLEINLESFKTILQESKLGKDDFIELNGGEPTLDIELKEKLDMVSLIGCRCNLSTNGRKFKDPDYTKNILENFHGKILIPLFGNNEISHEYWTGAVGSFQDTIMGIDNCISLIRELEFKFEIELKLLFFNEINESIPDIFKFIIDRFPYNYLTVSFNSLIWSKTTLRKKDKFTPNFESLFHSINNTLDYIKYFKGNIVLRSIPLCFIEESKHKIVLQKTPLNNLEFKDAQFISPYLLNNDQGLPLYSIDRNCNIFNYKYSICEKCNNNQVCDFTSLIEEENNFESFLESIGMLV